MKPDKNYKQQARWRNLERSKQSTLTPCQMDVLKQICFCADNDITFRNETCVKHVRYSLRSVEIAVRVLKERGIIICVYTRFENAGNRQDRHTRLAADWDSIAKIPTEQSSGGKSRNPHRTARTKFGGEMDILEEIPTEQNSGINNKGPTNGISNCNVGENFEPDEKNVPEPPADWMAAMDAALAAQDSDAPPASPTIETSDNCNENGSNQLHRFSADPNLSTSGDAGSGSIRARGANHDDVEF